MKCIYMYLICNYAILTNKQMAKVEKKNGKNKHKMIVNRSEWKI